MTSAVDKLPIELYLLIFDWLPSFRDICECSKVCRQWRFLASNELLWSSMLTQHCVNLHVERAEARTLLAQHAGQSKNKVIFASWFQRYAGFAESYTRMRRAFLRLEAWAQRECPIVLQSLAPGLNWVCGESVPVRELLSVVSDSPDMRDFIMAHHMHDGQRRRQWALEHGLFGSYECYGEFCSLSWLSSRMLQVVEMGRFRMLVFAWCHMTRNYLGVVVGSPAAHASRLMHHVVQLQPQSYRFVDRGMFGAFFTEYVDALVAGHHDVRDNTISLMPNCGAHTGTSLTHGIRTTISTMFCVDETPQFRVYRYQVTFELVDPDKLGYASVQLESRHWLLHYANEEYVHTSGPGVVGEFPVLSADQPFYRYCSRMEDDPSGLELVGFEGRFTVVPGSLDAPKGPNITLPVPYIELPIPMEII